MHNLNSLLPYQPTHYLLLSIFLYIVQDNNGICSTES